MAKKRRKSMDDPRNWGGSGRRRASGDHGGAQGDQPEGQDRRGGQDQRDRRGEAAGRGPAGGGRAGGSGRRDPRTIGAPQPVPYDWGDFEWTPPRDLRPPSGAQAPGEAPDEAVVAGAWKDFDTTYPEEPAPVAEPAPVDEEDWETAAEAAAARAGHARPPRERGRQWMPADEAAADEWQWVPSPSGPAARDERGWGPEDGARPPVREPAAGGYPAVSAAGEPVADQMAAGPPADRAAPRQPAAMSDAQYPAGPSDAQYPPSAQYAAAPDGARTEPTAAPRADAPAAPRAYRSYESRGRAFGADRDRDGRAPAGPGGAGGPGVAGPGAPDGAGPKPPRPSGPMGGPERPDGRRLVPAGSILIALIIGLALAALLNAQSLQRQAESMHVGPARTLMLALVKPVVAVSSTLRLDRPRAAIEDALGRGEQEQAGVHTRTTEPTPSSKPSDKPTAGGTKTPTSDPGTPATFSPTKDHKLALWVGGDSMAMVFGQSVVAIADGTGVIESALDYHVSSGLSRPDFFNWPNRIKAEMKSFQPDVAVFASGANDGQNVEYNGQVLQYGSKPWLDVYAKRVGAAMSLLGEKGKRSVWWVGMPIARDPDQSKIYRTLNEVYIAEAKKRPYVHYLDTYKMFSDKNGSYNDYLPGLSGKTELMRQGDGIHWSRAGGDLAATRLLEQISKVYPFDFKP